jgi:hypothetical protein
MANEDRILNYGGSLLRILSNSRLKKNLPIAAYPWTADFALF